MPIISSFDDLVAKAGARFVLPDGTHSVTIRGAKVERVKLKDGGAAPKLVLNAADQAGNSITIDLFMPTSEADLLSWEAWKQKSYIKGIQALGIRPEDTDTDVGRAKLIGRTVEILAKQGATGYTKYYLRRLLSNGTDGLPSAAERLASQLDATPTEASADGAGGQDENDIPF